ncbi:MAG: hypothetical protein WKG07_44995 [Hymenobacter sp.]
MTYPTARAGRLTLLCRAAQLAPAARQRSLPQPAHACPTTSTPEFTSYGLGYSRANLDDLYFPHRGLLRERARG